MRDSVRDPDGREIDVCSAEFAEKQRAFSQILHDLSYGFDLAEEVARRHQLETSWVRIHQGSSLVFQSGSLWLKILPAHLWTEWHTECEVLKALPPSSTLCCPQILAHGEVKGWFYLVSQDVAGFPLVFADLQQRGVLTSLARSLRELHGLSRNSQRFQNFEAPKLRESARLWREGEQALFQGGKILTWPERFRAPLKDFLTRNPPQEESTSHVLLHGDLNFEHILLVGSENLGVIDFGDAFWGPIEADLCFVLVRMMHGEPELQSDFLAAYGSAVVDGDALARRLLTTYLLQRHSDPCEDLAEYFADDRILNLDQLAAHVFPGVRKA